MLHRPLRSARTKIAGAGALLGTLLFVSPALAAPTVRNFGCVNATQTSTAPSGATLADVTVTGAGGGNTTTPVWNGTLSATGGKGERIEFTMPVTGGEQFDVVVGCRGHDGAYRPTSSGGFGGGGNGGWNYTTGMYAAGGGGASYVTNLTGETVYGVAGAGGGASGGGTTGEGEDAGGANGGNAQSGGADGGATDDEASGGTGGQGGNGGGLEGTYGLGNLGQSSYPGDSGSSLHGGAGGDSFEFWGGGGGGGGGGASIVTDGEDGSGGGGGAGRVQNGATLVSSTDAANAGDGQVSITYEVAGEVTTSPASHDFGAVTRGSSATHTVTVSNPGDAPVSLGQMAVAGVDADDFSLAADTCSNQPLASAGSCTVNVTFTPAASGARSAALQIPSSASGSPTAVALWGTGQATATLPAPTGTRPTQPAKPIGLRLTDVTLSSNVVRWCSGCSYPQARLSFRVNRTAKLHLTLQAQVRGQWRRVAVDVRAVKPGATGMLIAGHWHGQMLPARELRLMVQAQRGAERSAKTICSLVVTHA